MRRTIPLLSAILALQIGLALLLAVRKDPLASTTPQSPLIDTSLQHVDRMLIEAHAAGGASGASAAGTSGAGTLERVELTKKDGKWVLPDYFNAPADKFKLNDVLDELSGLQRGLPIATTASALQRFKLADDNFERRLTLSDGNRVLSTVYFGSSAGARMTDARTARDHAVYDVSIATYELPTQPSEWFDAGLLERDQDTLSELQVTASGQPTVQLQRQTRQTPPTPRTPAASPKEGAAAAAATPATPATPASAAGTSTPLWVDPELPAGRQVDGTRVDALARDIAELRVDAVLGLSAQPQWQQDHPLLTLVIHDGKGAGQVQTWTLSAPLPDAQVSPAGAGSPAAADARTAARAAHRAAARRGAAAAPAAAAASAPPYYVLKDSAQPWYFKLSPTTGKQLLDDGSPTVLLSAVKLTVPAHAPQRHSHLAHRHVS